MKTFDNLHLRSAILDETLTKIGDVANLQKPLMLD